MPIYEYACQECHRRSSILTLSPGRPDSARCRHCGSSNLDRLLSRFASPKSEEARLQSLMDPTNLSQLDETDASSIAGLMKKMGDEMGENTSEIEDTMLADSAKYGEALDQTDSL